ncbi:MAG: FAD-dependent oxidoreductase, partial [Pirellulales bacterium]|nr:FAD-dependent oxidoreductase [Pirellulales bacterium]
MSVHLFHGVLITKCPPYCFWLSAICVSTFTVASASVSADDRIKADLLVVGGTESGCAAAVQAARMGVKKIVLVNDIEWLGGQFSAEGLGAIDENLAHGYGGPVPIPRSGIFREVIDAIEDENARLYGGVKRPGNTRVITTVRPAVAEKVFRDLLAPYESSGQVVRRSKFRVTAVDKKGDRVVAVRFESTSDKPKQLTVETRMTIDASDWGDVIRLSGAAYDLGIDAKSEYQEPNAPEKNAPRTDMNPITWCMIVEEQSKESLIPKPPGYREADFTGVWGWIKEDFAYTSRRLVDGRGFAKIDHPDVLLINNPNIDYPLDQHTSEIASALEATEAGASTKNIVELTSAQREIIFADAKQRSLQYLYYLQSKFPKFRKMALSDEFKTADRLPPKPYIRESLRLVAQHVVKEQEVLGFGSRSNYAATMFPDAVFSWQSELDFHPTARRFIGSTATSEAEEDTQPWEADFRGKRRFGRGGTGRAVFPLRSFVPAKVTGLLGAQKNLGYTSIVSSSCRLHDQSVAAGQACGAVAGVSLLHDCEPHKICFRPRVLAKVWDGLLGDGRVDRKNGKVVGVPLAIWPFSDVDPKSREFVAIQQLALRRVLPLGPADTKFAPKQVATDSWRSEVQERLTDAGYEVRAAFSHPKKTRGEVAVSVWNEIREQPIPMLHRESADDADGDTIVDQLDALPFTKGTVSWPESTSNLINPRKLSGIRFNFAGESVPVIPGFSKDVGKVFDAKRGFGWGRDIQ